jgi:D-beta-D-heptose 7-phosphate kinase/D-beta-D-heptose 1-phosphate adenosyltransferase
MSHPLTRWIDGFAGRRVLVLGEAILDTYLEGTARRLCPEAPAPVVDLTARREMPGGAANAAVNTASLGADVCMISAIGDDAEGRRLRRARARARPPRANSRPPRPPRTLAKQRVVAESRVLLRFDQGDTGPIASRTEAALIDRLTGCWDACEAVIVSDYGYGIVTPGVRARLAALQAARPRVLVVDGKRSGAYRGVGPTAVKPNFAEVARLLGGDAIRHCERIDWVIARGERVLELTGARIATVTLDADGALVFERDRPPYRAYAQPARHEQASGAGDTFVAALALALVAGADAPAAADLATAAAAVVVAKAGTAVCTAGELRAQVSSDAKPAADRAALAARLDASRRQGKRIVFTNGCFDILHRGHVSYLSRAKALGDVLVVGVNSDASIRRLKGPTRPINALEDRVQVLAALSCVDHVIPFDEDTPHNLLRVVRPHVFAKGGDYTRDSLPEASLVEALGGAVHILPYLADRSTTDIIARIRAAHADSDGAYPGAVGALAPYGREPAATLDPGMRVARP